MIVNKAQPSSERAGLNGVVKPDTNRSSALVLLRYFF